MWEQTLDNEYIQTLTLRTAEYDGISPDEFEAWTILSNNGTQRHENSWQVISEVYDITEDRRR